MKKSKLTPDIIRDAPIKSGGTFQCPGPHMIMPARAYGDNRFNQFPMTFRCFSICCSHANSWTGIFFPNQLYIAQVLQCSQQAVSQHMRKLVEYGYIHKLRNADMRRTYGKRGALWRVIYDPSKTLEDCISMQPAQDRDPALEKEVAAHTINVMTADNKRRQAVDNRKRHKTELVQGTASNTVIEHTDNKTGLVLDNKPQLVNNSRDITNINTSKNINESDCRKLCNEYSGLLQATYGKGFTYDMRQMQLASEILQTMSLEAFIEDARGVLKWKHEKNQAPPYSLQYFINRKVSQAKAKDGKDVQDIIKAMSNRMKLR